MNCTTLRAFRYLAASGLLLLARLATAQTTPSPAASSPEKVYTFVEQMPQLPGGGGGTAIVKLIQQHVSYPRHAELARAEGRVFVSFTVAPNGLVEDIAVVKRFRPDCDSAVVEAVKQLPRFEPGRQVGRAVPVRFTMPVTFQLQAAPQEVIAYGSTEGLYISVEHMPVYPGGGGLPAFTSDLLREFTATSKAMGCSVPTFPVFITFTVGPSGSIYDVKSINNTPLPSSLTPSTANAKMDGSSGTGALHNSLQPLPVACEAALVSAAQKLPHFTPGEQSGRKVAVNFTIRLIGPAK